MRRLLPLTSLFFILALILTVAGISISTGGANAAPGNGLQDSYIVTFKAGIEPSSRASEKAKAYGLALRHVYTSALHGFSAVVPPAQLEKLQNDPDIATIMPDRPVSAFTDQRPLGIRRTQADRNATALIGTHTNPISVDVAVIDTGIDPSHPDLNVVGGVSCVPRERSYADENGHGTHVAGTIGATDNGSGVVGVAPGVRLWAVRVLNANGEGQFSDVICGVDWVTANAATIEVANMSLGGEERVDACNGGSLHAAICESIAAGVTYVVAAGNSSMDASGFVPAAYPEVITVSAIVDTDGAPGGRGTSSYFYGNDDTLATFSNFGAPVDIAAPGYNVYSTWPGGGYTYLSGTSMASPHVAGAAAIYRYLNPGASQAAVRSYLMSIAWPQASTDGFSGDVDSFAEPLLNVGSIGGAPLPPPPTTCSINPASGLVSSVVTITCANFWISEPVKVYWDSTATAQKTSFIANQDGAGTGKVTIPAAVSGDHRIIARGANSGLEVSQTFAVLPGMKLSSTSGKAGASVIVTLSGFAAGDAIAINWDAIQSPIATATASTTGGATVFLTVPDGVAGSHLITATGQAPGGGSAPTVQANFTIVPGLSLIPTAGRTGTLVTVKLGGYAAGEQVSLSWQSSATVKVSVGQATVSELGAASIVVTVPESTKGAHLIEGIGSSANQASALFTITPATALSTTSGTVGSSLTMTISGFAANETVNFKWYATATTSTALTSLVSSATGGASVTVPIPESTYGAHRLEAVGPSSGSISVYLTVLPSISLSPAAGPAGTNVTASFSGFGANEQVTMKWFDTAWSSAPIAGATSSATGSGSATFVVPANASVGEHKVEGNGAVSYARGSAMYVVESSGPPPSTDPACSIDPASGAVGTRITVTCSNFALNETVRIYLDDTSSAHKAAIWTGTSGGGSVAFSLGDTTGGDHRVIAVGGASGLTIENTFTVVPSVSLSASSGKVGALILVTLKGFAAGETVALTWDGGVTIKSVAVSASGSAVTSISVPEAPRGDHEVGTVGGASGLQASAKLTVVPSIALSPAIGNVGKPVAATLRGYLPGETVALNWFDGGSVTAQLGSATVSALGSGSVSFTVPEAVGGNHPVEAVGSAGSTSSAAYTVTAGFAISPTTGAVGSSIALSLTGFAGGETITVTWYETTTSSAAIGTLTASGTGTANGSVTVPQSAVGSHKIEVRGAVSGGSAYLYYSVKGAISLNSTSGPPGISVTATMTGYKPGETVNVTWYRTATSTVVAGSGVANAVGTVSVTFTVPADAADGDHKVEASGLGSFQKASATFTVAAEPSSAIQAGPPTFDVPVADEFNSGSGELPAGWTVDSTSNGQIAISWRGNAVGATAPGGTGGSAWLIRDGAVFSQADVQVQLRPSRTGASAGVVLAWNGPGDYIAVLVNSDAGRIEVVEVVGGVVRSTYRSENGSIAARNGHAGWLRADSGSAGGNAWVNLYWSTDGVQFAAIGSVDELLNLSGRTGLVVSGSNVPNVEFDDFAARRGQSSGPLETSTPTEDFAPTPEPTATTSPEPTPTEIPTEAPTEEPTATPEPPPTEVPPTDVPVVPEASPAA